MNLRQKFLGKGDLDDEHAPAPSPDAALQASASPLLTLAASSDEITREQLDRWAETYGTKWRQLRRWIVIGREKGDRCPLDAPALMPAWWLKHMKQRVPPKLLAAAAASQTTATAPPLAADAAESPAASDDELDNIDLGTTTLNDGEELIIARQMVFGLRKKYFDAFKANQLAEANNYRVQLRDALKTLKEARASDREEKKMNGDLLPRSEIEMNVFALLKMVAAMRAGTGVRLRADLAARFPTMTAEHVEAIVEIVEAQIARGDELFRDLGVIKVPEDVFRLAA